MSDQEKINIVNKKIRQNINIGDSIVQFVIIILFKLPLFICVLIPFTILNIACRKILAFLNKLFGQRPRRPQRPQLIIVEPQQIRKKQDRQFDIVVFGATGYTGKFACEFLAKQKEEKINWAIAGRNQSRLEEVKKNLVKINPSLNSLQILIAESEDREQLELLVNNTKVVIATAGPFDKHGSLLVALCAAYGTDYCDITGELSWVRDMIQLYDNQAYQTGARIVNSVGLDSLPWDLITFKLNQRLKESGENLEKIEFFDDILLTPSGGTLSTLQNSLEGVKAQMEKISFDPLLKIIGKNEKSENKHIARKQNFIGFQDGKWIGKWFLEEGNSCVIKRSNAILQYGPKLLYREKKVFHNFFDAFNEMFNSYFMATFLFNSWIRDFAQGIIFPAPGQGLTEQQRLKNYAKITGKAVGSGQSKISAEIYFTDDPGYLDTGRMVSQVALSLLRDNSNCGGGFHTGASSCGDHILERLQQYGTAFRFLN